MKPSPKVASLDKARLDKLLSRQQSARDTLAGVTAEIDEFRRQWSFQHRYCMVLTVEQLRKTLA